MKLPTISTFMSLLLSIGSAAEYYVSPSGDDSASGAQNAPLATLAEAQARVRKDGASKGATVIVADGVYYLADTLQLEHQDSGSANTPVIYRAENEGKAILSGGSLLELDWKAQEGGVYEATTPAGLEIDQLFINGVQQRMARYPNYDASLKDTPYQGYSADAFSAERAARWANPKGGYIHAMHVGSWGGYHYQITGKDEAGEVTYEGGWQNNRKMGMHKEYRMVENIYEELDAPGEWFHNAETGVLSYIPNEGTDMTQAKVEVVRLRHIVEFNGSEESPVQNIQFDGFTVRHAARTFMDCKEPLLRSDWAIYRGGAFFLTGTESVSIVDCVFDQVGGNAIFINNYNRDTLVKGCHIHHTGASGVCFVGSPDAVYNPLFEYGQRNDLTKIDLTPGPKTNEYPKNGVVEDCLIHNVGTVERQPAGVQIEMAAGIRISDVSVYDCARAGINIGDGAWGGHTIERCDVFSTVLETHDHGSFNSWGRDRYWRADHLQASQKAVDENPDLPFLDAMTTTTIRDSRWRCEHGWDIDLDDGSSNYDIYNNLMLCGGLKLREGFRRKAWNNIVVNNGLSAHVWFSNSKDQLFSNVMARASMPYVIENANVDGCSNRNFFYSSSEGQLKALQEKHKWETESLLGENPFVDEANGDYTIKEGSKAFDIGFKNFPMDQFGVKKPSLKAIAKTPKFGPKAHQPVKQKAPTDIKYTWHGATLKGLSGEEFSAYGVTKAQGGVVLNKIKPGSLLEQAGFKNNDLIQHLAGKAIKVSEDVITALGTANESKLKAVVVRNQQKITLTVPHSYETVYEAAQAPADFKKLPLTSGAPYRVQSRPGTSNDPIKVLSDGKLQKAFGSLFANNEVNGMYKVDLGSSKTVESITSYAFDKSGRNQQILTVFGSNSESNPGWELENYTEIGAIDNRQHLGDFTAASIQGQSGNVLGNYRWILWRVYPIKGHGLTNPAMQELSVKTQ